jgi:hypothetical protein
VPSLAAALTSPVMLMGAKQPAFHNTARSPRRRAGFAVGHEVPTAFVRRAPTVNFTYGRAKWNRLRVRFGKYLGDQIPAIRERHR